MYNRLNTEKKLRDILAIEAIKANEPLRDHTTFRIGGPADIYVEIGSAELLRNCLAVLSEDKIPFFVIGNGSNLLASDLGYRGVILRLAGQFTEIRTEGTVITAGAGAQLIRVAAAARDAGLTGLEFASGIPGTVGGAVRMNAGAYGGEMKQVLTHITAMDYDGELHTIPAEEAKLGYRTSMFKDSSMIILGAELELAVGDPSAIKSRVEELAVQRKEKQPLEYPSAGSTFKRPEGNFAGKLIMEAGLRGFSVGDAQVSEKHCGFVVNKGNATASQVKELMEEVRRRVYENSGIMLEPEVLFLGEEA